MRKIALLLGVLITSTIMISTIIYRYQELKEIRKELTDVRTTENYEEQVDLSIDRLLEYGNIKKPHKKWIKEFIILELNNGAKYQDTSYYVLLKLRDKNVSFSQDRQINVKMEILKIKEMKEKRKIHVDNAKIKYVEIQNKTFNRQFENLLFGDQITIKDIKYY